MVSTARSAAEDEATNTASRDGMVWIAADQVLATLELFEMILLYLPMKDLLFAQAVSASWKTIIDSSNKLQRALFFLPTVHGPAFFHEDPRCSEVARVLASGATSCTFSDQDTSCYFLYSSRANDHNGPLVRESLDVSTITPNLICQLKRCQVYLNPLLLAKIYGMEEFCQYYADILPPTYIDTDGYNTKGGERPEASWRRMLITQPPLGEANFAVWDRDLQTWEDLTIQLQGPGCIASLTKAFVGMQRPQHCVRKGVLQLERWETGMDLEKLGPFEGMKEVVARMMEQTNEDESA